MATGIWDKQTTGDAYIDSLLSGWRWDGGPVTYGFPQNAAAYGDAGSYFSSYPSNHFQPVSPTTATMIDTLLRGESARGGSAMALTPVSGFTNLTFAPTDPALAETDMRVGVASTVPYAYGLFPGEQHAEGGADGDVWIGNTGAYGAAFQLQNPVSGSWGYHATMWAVGRALGLQSGYLTMPKDKQFFEYTVMTYYNAPSVALPNEGAAADRPKGDHPEIQNLNFYTNQTYMMLDIAALQQMYGANYNFRSGDDVYRWSPTTGSVSVNGILKGVAGDGLVNAGQSNEIFQTIWDGGGTDTYDLSNYAANLKIDLRPGEYSSFSEAQRPYIGSDPGGKAYFARGNVYNAMLHDSDPRSLIEDAIGGSGNDVIRGNAAVNALRGNAGNDTLQGGAGNDDLDGGDGEDTVQFTGSRARLRDRLERGRQRQDRRWCGGA